MTQENKKREPNKYVHEGHEYLPSTVSLAEEYIDKYLDGLDHFHESDPKSMLLNDVIPMVSSLALHLGVHRDTIDAWSKDDDKKDFSDIVEKIMATQETCLINGSLKGTLCKTTAKLLLSKHGYTDKIDQTHSGPDGGPIETKSLVVEFVGKGGRG